MRNTGRAGGWLVLGLAVVAVGAGLTFWIIRSHRSDVAKSGTTTTTQPTSAPAPKPKLPAPDEPKPPEPVAWVDVVRTNVPSYPATQPLALPVDLPQAAHLLVRDPIYLDSRLNLWVTYPSAPRAPETLKKPNPEAEYVVPERVLFVHWAPDATDTLTPRIVTPRPGGGYDYVWSGGKIRLPGDRAWRWDRARNWDDKFLVPTATGVSVFHIPADKPNQPTEAYQELRGVSEGSTRPASRPSTAPSTQPAPTATGPEPQMLFDGQGFLAWLPWEHGQPGGRGAARYVDDHWVSLDAKTGWPEKIVHLIPLLGGSVMELALDDEGKTRLNVTELAGAAAPDRNEVEKLVDGLSAETAKERDAAFEKLTRYGPAIRPILKEMLDKDLPPEAQVRVKQLMTQQVQPLLGPLSLLGNQVEVVTRHGDGGAVFYAPAGVSVATPDGESTKQVPAWLAVRPGHAVALLPEAMVHELDPAKARIEVVESRDDDWIVTGDAAGPKRFLGVNFVDLLRKGEAGYSHLVGVDRRGRWLFRKPGEDAPTLVLDPTLPDATPRLPVWNYTTANEVGWDKENWPAVRQVGGLFRLKEEAWDGLAEGEDLLTRADQIPPTTQPTTAPSTAPTTVPTTLATTGPASTQPTTGPSLADLGPPLLVAPDGTRYYGGTDDLRANSPDGRDVTWPLPGAAAGKDPVTLIRTTDGRLFLFNQPGRVLRINPTPKGPEPFVLEATFSHNIPTADDPTRIWLDPAGRIIMAHGTNLCIMFPQGFINPHLKSTYILDPDEGLE